MGHLYQFIDDALSWNESLATCKQHGALAMADDAETFNVLLGMYKKYRAANGTAVGVWLDGTRANATSSWRCEDDTIDCGADMPWSVGEPNRPDSEHCVLVWYSRTDGVANFGCDGKMPTICDIP